MERTLLRTRRIGLAPPGPSRSLKPAPQNSLVTADLLRLRQRHQLLKQYRVPRPFHSFACASYIARLASSAPTLERAATCTQAVRAERLCIFALETAWILRRSRAKRLRRRRKERICAKNAEIVIITKEPRKDRRREEIGITWTFRRARLMLSGLAPTITQRRVGTRTRIAAAKTDITAAIVHRAAQRRPCSFYDSVPAPVKKARATRAEVSIVVFTPARGR